jgi:hypothetical protein
MTIKYYEHAASDNYVIHIENTLGKVRFYASYNEEVDSDKDYVLNNIKEHTLVETPNTGVTFYEDGRISYKAKDGHRLVIKTRADCCKAKVRILSDTHGGNHATKIFASVGDDFTSVHTWVNGERVPEDVAPHCRYGVKYTGTDAEITHNVEDDTITIKFNVELNGYIKRNEVTVPIQVQHLDYGYYVRVDGENRRFKTSKEAFDFADINGGTVNRYDKDGDWLPEYSG